ncbi:MAG: response regulator [Alphaproteobacteria bacterium]|nr:response regulator [Alphaproteobacteria bacterium]
MLDRIFIRNFVLFVMMLLSCAGTLSYVLVSGDQELEKSDDLVFRTHEVITKAEQLSRLIESMLAAQRGYLLTADKTFLEKYETQKADVSNHMADLSELTIDNQSQQSRLNEVRNYFTDFSTQLEERTKYVLESEDLTKLQDVEIVNALKENIIRINTAILDEEYELLNQRISALNEKKDQYFNTLLISVFAGTVLLLLLNAFLLNTQRKQRRAEESLKDTEDRFVLAVEGTEDGIFDWDIKNGKVFYSGRFFEMLGYDRAAFTGSVEDSKELVHPDDIEGLWSCVEQYLKGELSEYRQEFRMKHSSGRWIWIQSRAKALYDKSGNAYRMVGAHTDITHMKKAQHKLKAEKKEAEEANRAKSEFLAHMSHEIRTPLTAINGIAEIFEKNNDNFNDKQKHLVSTLASSTASLKDLINDILDFSKIESGELELDEHGFNLDEVFQSVISMMSLKASEKGISFVFDYNDLKSFGFFGDDKRMRQILVNLINNAIKFTDHGGVTVKAEIEERDGNDFLSIEVTDTGIGIAPENFDLVFERFKQADSSVSRKYGGSGLGLPISRSLARLMGGDIFLHSETDKGSTFTLLLPMKYADREENIQSTNDNSKLNDKIRSVLTGENKILVVEDYQGNVVVLSYILEEIDAAFDVAKTGAEALKLWNKNHYDIVLMDIQMPEMDGFTATKEIRRIEEQKKLERTPVIGMTAHALVGDKDKCIEAGMDSYLPKPIVEADLKREILKYLKQQNKKAA